MPYLYKLVPDTDPRVQTLMDTFTLLGIAWTVRLSLHLLVGIIRGLRTHIWSRLVSLDFKKKYGPWAVITGCTDGIGLEYARLLATRGMNLILVGRNPQKLDAVRQELIGLG